jgi:hypothetical protein
VIQALGKIGGNEALRYLQSNIDDPDEAVKEAIEQAINEICMNEDMTIFEMEKQSEEHGS